MKVMSVFFATLFAWSQAAALGSACCCWHDSACANSCRITDYCGLQAEDWHPELWQREGTDQRKCCTETFSSSTRACLPKKEHSTRNSNFPGNGQLQYPAQIHGTAERACRGLPVRIHESVRSLYLFYEILLI